SATYTLSLHDALPISMRGLSRQHLASDRCQRIEFRAPVCLRGSPLGGDPALLLELVQSRIERAFADLQHIAGDLLQTLADSPTRSEEHTSELQSPCNL